MNAMCSLALAPIWSSVRWTISANNRAANQATTVDFSLTVSAIELEEIVATGTPVAAARRRELGNAVTSLEADQIVATAALTSVPELLNGRVSGLVAMAGTGVLGAGPRLKIRGTASLALDDQPLIYGDGVRVNNDIGACPNSQGSTRGSASWSGRESLIPACRPGTPASSVSTASIRSGSSSSTSRWMTPSRSPPGTRSNSSSRRQPAASAPWTSTPSTDAAGIPGYDPATNNVEGPTSDNLLNMIIQERSRELFLEGHRFWDHRSFEIALDPRPGAPYPKGGAYGSMRCSPLPDVEKNNNPNIPS